MNDKNDIVVGDLVQMINSDYWWGNKIGIVIKKINSSNIKSSSVQATQNEYVVQLCGGRTNFSKLHLRKL